LLVGTIVIAALAAVVRNVACHRSVESADELHTGPAIGMPGGPPSSAAGLRQRITAMENRLREHPHDAGAAVLLADALLRQGRVSGDSRPAARAAEVLKGASKANPSSYDPLRMLGAIYLSLHRFRDALETGRRARDLRPHDAWNYGVMADALIELGEYDEAFETIDTMAGLRPSAAAYARVSYARELQGDLDGALHAMQMAAKATDARDPEAQAWYASQLGELYLRIGKPDDADLEFRRASYVFPEYLLAMVGLGNVQAARGDYASALAIYLQQLKRAPTLDLAARVGDLYLREGNSAKAEYYFQLAEETAGPAIAQTEPNLALFLAEHDRRPADAVRIAEAVWRVRRDIFTEDALAWAYFKTGRLEDAVAASQRALRTGTRDAEILRHASEIRRAQRRSAVGGKATWFRAGPYRLSKPAVWWPTAASRSSPIHFTTQRSPSRRAAGSV
jgi:tetratricopeptide (TPR) repeat protein